MAAQTSDVRVRRTFAQWYCLVAGATLLLAGIFGFVADGSFDSGSRIQGDLFLGFEVNGWHNLVHLASGLLLLAAANTRPTAKTVALLFGVAYGFVALWGLIDGDEVFNVLPVNPADNLLHIFLSAAAILAAYLSPTTKHQQVERKRSKQRARHKDDAVEQEDAERREFLDDARGDGGRFDRTADHDPATGRERLR